MPDAPGDVIEIFKMAFFVRGMSQESKNWYMEKRGMDSFIKTFTKLQEQYKNRMNTMAQEKQTGRQRDTPRGPPRVHIAESTKPPWVGKSRVGRPSSSRVTTKRNWKANCMNYVQTGKCKDHENGKCPYWHKSRVRAYFGALMRDENVEDLLVSEYEREDITDSEEEEYEPEEDDTWYPKGT